MKTVVFWSLALVCFTFCPVQSNVIIVGGGLAGLMAAKTLKDSGEGFILLESRSELGGRAMTVELPNSHKVNVGPMSINPGAKWVHGACNEDHNGNDEHCEYNPVWKLAQENDLTTELTDFDNVAFFNKTKFCKDNRSEKKYKNLEDILVKLKKKQTTFGDEDSIEKALIEEGWAASSSLDEAIQWYCIDYEYAATASELAVSHIDLKAYTHNNRDTDERLITDSEGIAKLTNALAKYVGIEGCPDTSEKVHCNHVVTSIDYNSNGVTVKTKRTGTQIEEVFSGDYAIITVSLGVLQHEGIVFNPPLPDKKTKAIKDFGMGTLTTVFAAFKEDFWSETLASTKTNKKKVENVVAGSDDQNFFKAHLSLSAYNEKWRTLVFSAIGDQSARLESQTLEETKNQVMEMLKTMYGPNISNPLDFHVPIWIKDPNFYGSYSYWPVGYTNESHDALKEPVEGRVFFAGEATDRDYYGFLQGAYCSGIAQARMINCAKNSTALTDCKLSCIPVSKAKYWGLGMSLPSFSLLFLLLIS
eukprot:m.307748 g.307748  ORF g.307748 m.307748 type:complete len:530 (+) comp42762_c0_seq1:36-1625(+)